MSGNGVRCLAHAAYRAQERNGTVTYQVATEAGVREVGISEADDPRPRSAVSTWARSRSSTRRATWSAVGADPGRPVTYVGVGNLHTVVGVDDVGDVDLAAIGAKVPDINLEIVAGPEPDAVTMRGTSGE